MPNRSKASEVSRVTGVILGEILTDKDSHAVRAELAQLRRGLGKQPGELPETLGILLRAMPEEMYGCAGCPSREEWAVHTALTLFALHQQGKDPAVSPMHVKGKSLGAGIAQLVSSDDDLERIRRRLNMLLSASDIAETASYLRFIIPLLRDAGIEVDYVDLAAKLYQFQFEDGAQAVRLMWGQEFYAQLYRQSKNNEE